MCIRDRRCRGAGQHVGAPGQADAPAGRPGDDVGLEGPQICLLYTSDAADERSSVDLGGRRVIKKKKERKNGSCWRSDSKRRISVCISGAEGARRVMGSRWE